MTDLGAIAADLRHSAALSDPARLCRARGLEDGAKRQATGLLIRCPSHGEKTPSCSVTTGPDGTVRVKCFACDYSCDALGLIETVVGCRSFRETIDAACDLAGCPRPGDSTARDWTPPPRSEQTSTRPEPKYPWSTDLVRFWDSLGQVIRNPLAAELLRRRAIDPAAVDTWGLARVMLGSSSVPEWARYRGDGEESRPWTETGHILIVPAYDHDGAMRSVRAWRVLEGGDVPKRLPPSGCKASGLVQANLFALHLLRGETGPTRIVIAEGEPDYLVWATRFDGPVIGIGSGSWTEDFASKIPLGSTVILRTDRDDAGERYARAIAKTCEGRCQIRRAAA